MGGAAVLGNLLALSSRPQCSALLRLTQVNTNPSLLCGTAVDWDIKEPLAESLLRWLSTRSSVGLEEDVAALPELLCFISTPLHCYGRY